MSKLDNRAENAEEEDARKINELILWENSSKIEQDTGEIRQWEDSEGVFSQKWIERNFEKWVDEHFWESDPNLQEKETLQSDFVEKVDWPKEKDQRKGSMQPTSQTKDRKLRMGKLQ